MKVTALAGGVGGAKLLIGLQAALTPGDLTAVVNTGDDAVVYGLHVSPDIDIVTYWLAGVADRDRGWGISGDTFDVMAGLAAIGRDTWFGLGDRDLATCLHRTERLRSGATLTAVTDEIRRALNVPTRVLPMSDDPVRTRVTTSDGRTLDFQEYFVKERHEPFVREVTFAGISDAKPGPDVPSAIDEADVVIVCPSNPVVSVAPIISLPGVRDQLRRHPRVVAVTPIVRGAPLKGPADRLLAAVGADVSASGVARLYADFCNSFVVDASDRSEVSAVQAAGMATRVCDTIMLDPASSERLAREILES